jgi:hypothetical protein
VIAALAAADANLPNAAFAAQPTRGAARRISLFRRNFIGLVRLIRTIG